MTSLTWIALAIGALIYSIALIVLAYHWGRRDERHPFDEHDEGDHNV